MKKPTVMRKGSAKNNVKRAEAAPPRTNTFTACTDSFAARGLMKLSWLRRNEIKNSEFGH